LQNKELGDFSIRVLTDDVLELGPLHFLTLLVKESTLTLGRDTLFTDKGRFSAVRVDTNHNAAIAVDTIRTVLDRFTHNK